MIFDEFCTVKKIGQGLKKKLNSKKSSIEHETGLPGNQKQQYTGIFEFMISLITAILLNSEQL